MNSLNNTNGPVGLANVNPPTNPAVDDVVVPKSPNPVPKLAVDDQLIYFVYEMRV